ncbi:MAG: response regulator, partial [Proteobacteria bacterium]|nr:response regulator [Pseudomonadota bacterium]
DMTMPVMLGTELSRKMLEIRKNIPILICTGFSEQVNEEKAKSFGIKGYINKPILLKELVSKVRELLDHCKRE